MNKKLYSVGEIAKRSGIKISALHFYENKGLIFSTRNAGNQRRYGGDTLRRVSIIKAAQALGVTLAEISEAFASLPEKTVTADDWERFSKNWQQKLALRIEHLQTLRDSLDHCIGCGCLSMSNCPLYNADDKLAAEGPGPVLLNDKMGVE